MTILDQAIAHGNGKLDRNEVKKLLGTIDDSLLFELLEAIVDGDGKKVFDMLADTPGRGPVGWPGQVKVDVSLISVPPALAKRRFAATYTEFIKVTVDIASSAI